MNQNKYSRGIRVSRLDDTGEIVKTPHAIRNNSQMMPQSGMYSNPPAEPFEQEQIATEPNPIPIEQKYVYCIDVCNHIASCPLCSKYYNTDKTVYLLVIALLSIVCIILMKRMLEKS